MQLSLHAGEIISENVLSSFSVDFSFENRLVPTKPTCAHVLNAVYLKGNITLTNPLVFWLAYFSFIPKWFLQRCVPSHTLRLLRSWFPTMLCFLQATETDFKKFFDAWYCLRTSLLVFAATEGGKENVRISQSRAKAAVIEVWISSTLFRDILTESLSTKPLTLSFLSTKSSWIQVFQLCIHSKELRKIHAR